MFHDYLTEKVVICLHRKLTIQRKSDSRIYILETNLEYLSKYKEVHKLPIFCKEAICAFNCSPKTIELTQISKEEFL